MPVPGNPAWVPSSVLARNRQVDCGRLLAVMALRAGPKGVYAMLGDRLGESSGKFTNIRVLPSEGPAATGRLSRLTDVADVIEYEVEEDGSYHWTMWAWTGAGIPSIPRQEAPSGAMA